MLETPILFLVFNRPDTTRQVFEAIRQAKPKQLFVAADGPRADKEGEKERCEEVIKIATAVDWDCELKTLFRNENLGCGRGPATAIDWFFENVEQGIILEDDCLPDPSFFLYCELLLKKFKNNSKVMLISGLNLFDKRQLKDSYFFSINAGTWGWATWGRAWKDYDYELSSWNQKEQKEKALKYFQNSKEKKYYQEIFDKTFLGEDVTWWDYQWLYLRAINEGIGIIPKKNLISNIGFGNNATHTFDTTSFQSKLKIKSMDFPLRHSSNIEIDCEYDKNLSTFFWDKKNKESILSMIKQKIKAALNKA